MVADSGVARLLPGWVSYDMVGVSASGVMREWYSFTYGDWCSLVCIVCIVCRAMGLVPLDCWLVSRILTRDCGLVWAACWWGGVDGWSGWECCAYGLVRQ